MSEETQLDAEQTTEAPVVETPQVEEPKVHPAYEKLLSELPEAWHAKITPHLQEQDKYFQQQLEKYTPFKKFADDGITADLIDGGLGLARAIDEDPVTVYQNLQKYLKDQGLLTEEAKQAAADIMEKESGDDFESMFDGEKIPAALQKEIDALKAKTEEVDSWKNQQELDRETEIQLAQLDADMAALKSQHTITEAHEIAIYDLMNAALAAGRTISIADAAKQLSDMIGGFQSAGAPAAEEAPTVIGSSGGAGVVAPNLSIPKDDKGKKEMLARMFDQYNAANR